MREMDPFNMIVLFFINLILFSFPFIHLFIFPFLFETKFCYTFETIDTHLVHGRGNKSIYSEKKYCFSHSYNTRGKKESRVHGLFFDGNIMKANSKIFFVIVFEFAC